MNRRSYLSTAGVSVIAAAMLFAFTGCEDKQARTDAAEARQKISALEAKIVELETAQGRVNEAVKAVHDKIAAQVNERIDKIEGSMLNSSKELLTKLTQDAQTTRDAATQIVGSARTDFDKELGSVKTTIAADVQKIREETKVHLEELKKFMDNQLRELYPYAYQPRRDSKAPPEPDTK